MFKNRFLKNESSLTKTNPSVSFIREKYLNIEELAMMEYRTLCRFLKSSKVSMFLFNPRFNVLLAARLAV